jgi:hypothetical protein
LVAVNISVYPGDIQVMPAGCHICPTGHLPSRYYLVGHSGSPVSSKVVRR